MVCSQLFCLALMVLMNALLCCCHEVFAIRLCSLRLCLGQEVMLPMNGVVSTLLMNVLLLISLVPYRLMMCVVKNDDLKNHYALCQQMLCVSVLFEMNRYA